MKRYLGDCVANSTRSKKPRLVSYLPYQKKLCKQPWVSATHIYNHMVKDPCVDWLKNKTKRAMKSNPIWKNAYGFDRFIKQRGIEFEDKVVKYISEQILAVKTAGSVITDENCKKTIQLMKEGIPIIYSAPLQDSKKKLQGIADLLVRSDYLTCLTNNSSLSPIEEYIKAPNLNGEYHYVVVDIKFSKIPFRSDGKHILNSGKFSAYKGQLYIYTEMVGAIQGYQSPYAFIMGRGWSFTQKDIVYSEQDTFERLGTIDFSTIDNDIVKKTKDAINWVRDVKTDGASWVLNPPSRVELYPNMCVDSGYWQKEKHKIAAQLKEITMIWHCGIKHREIALDSGIESWKDPLCSAENLGINSHKIKKTIDCIIKINRDNIGLMSPKKLSSESIQFLYPEQDSVYVDFETVGDMTTDPVSSNRVTRLFMIGVGWYDENATQWKYKNFTSTGLTDSEELTIMNSFVDFMEERNFPYMYCWSAEEKIWRFAEMRHFDNASDDIELKDRISDKWKNISYNWVDLYQLFTSEPITIKGCYNFRLKDIASQMNKHGMIKTILPSSRCTSGLDAMILAWKTYQTDNKDISLIEKEIIPYNEFDCKVLWDIVSYLKTKC